MNLYNFLMSSIAFWLAWITIPVLLEFIPAIGSFLILMKKVTHQKKTKEMKYYPEISLIVPVYNSEDTLEACIRSIHESNYPKEAIRILLVNNEGKDGSFEIFRKAQQQYKDLHMSWLNAKQGKSKALNLALYNSEGKYIIHIDSDGVLHPDAIKNMVTMFEQNPEVDCLTGTIMTNPELIEQTNGTWKRLFRKIEFFEYCQAFLAGRNLESELNHIFTVSGAFSAFRKSAILKTKLYNTDTVCEDTHITFQVRDKLKKRVKLCTNAFFFVEPITNLNHLYIQRQRWQRGEIEVAHIFMKKNLGLGFRKLKEFTVRVLLFDHTFAFPRMIWYFALLCLMIRHYPIEYVLISVIIVYLLYVIAGFCYYLSICICLRSYKELRMYYCTKWYVLLLLPLYNFCLFWFRFAGIINSMNSEQTWKSRNLTEERNAFWQIIKGDAARVFSFLQLRKKEERKIE